MSEASKDIPGGESIAKSPVAPKDIRLETDTFCAHCKYNLFGQEVFTDERLQLLVCRCPECGQFHAAGNGVSSTKVWLNRLSTTMLTVWVLACIIIVAGVSAGLGGLQFDYLDNFTRYIQQTPDGRDAYSTYQNGHRVWLTTDTYMQVPVVNTRRIVADR